jgi:3-deoxy-D-manno-octulosonic-acid transferase
MDFIIGLLLYNILIMMAFLIGWPYLLFAAILPNGKKWRQRCGFVPKSSKKPVWIHAASMGETALIPPLVEALEKEIPGFNLAVSTMTRTGQERAFRINRGEMVFFLPLDFLCSVGLSLARIKPSVLVLMETEIWPNLMWLCSIFKIPVFIVNARLSDRSLPWYRAFGFLFRPLLSKVECIACQGSRDAERYEALGIDRNRIIDVGNIKYDAIRQPVNSEQKVELRKRFGFYSQDLILVAGSTRNGEEEIILDAWAEMTNKIKLVIAPRHPDRFSEVDKMIAAKGFNYSKRSNSKDKIPSGDILLLDTMGELVDIYAAGDIAFVGGSLVPVGGHNPLEPAAMAVPVLFGPHMFNARESSQSLLAAHAAVQVADGRELRSVLDQLTTDPESLRRYGTNARAVVDRKRGASDKVSKIIATLLKRA